MSELIMSWLNDEVQLSSKVNNFEKDFSNGFLLGELLAKYNQQLNFSKFINQDVRQAKLHNFQLLEPTLKILKIHFDPEIAKNIMQGQSGEVIKILYQIKMLLEKSNKKQKLKPALKKIPAQKEQYDTMQSNLFMKKLKQTQPAQKTVDLSKHLQKFEDFQEKQNLIMTEQRQLDQAEKKRVQEDIRKIQLNKLQRNMAFMDDWQQKGLENWQQNMLKFKQREQKIEEFKIKQQEKIDNKHQEQQKEQAQQFEADINQLEQNLQKYGITQSENKSKVTASSRIKSQSKMVDNNQKVRDKRRRKMIVEQANFQNDLEIQQREYLILEKLKQQSIQEKEFYYEVWRAEQCKLIMEENRNLRQQQYEEKAQTIQLNHEKQEKQLLDIKINEMVDLINVQQNKLKKLEQQQKQRHYKQIYNQMENITDTIFDISDKIYISQQDNDNNQIDNIEIQKACELFINNIPQIEKVSHRHQNSVEVYKNQDQKESYEFLSQKEYEAYLGTDSNPIMAEIIKYILTEKQKQKDNNFEQHKEYLNLRLCLTGGASCGKKTLALHLKNKYNLEIINLEDILENSEQIKEFLKKGQNIPDWLIIDLIKQRIDEIYQNQSEKEFLDQYEKQQDFTKGFVLVNFPQNQNQARLFLEKIVDFKPSVIENETIWKKSQILTNFQENQISEQKAKCGIDAIFNIKLDFGVALERICGQHIHEDSQAYHLVYDPPKTDEIFYQDGLEQSNKNYQMMSNRQNCYQNNYPQILNFFSDFDLFLEDIDGTNEIQDIEQKIEMVVKKRKQEYDLLYEKQKREYQQKLDDEIQQEEKLKKEQQWDIINVNEIKQKSQNLESQQISLQNLQNGPKELIKQMWILTLNSYVQSLKESFQVINRQNKIMQSFMAETIRRFLELIQKPDNRQVLVMNFQEEYNHFITENQSFKYLRIGMIEEEKTKEEMHQKVDDLQDNLADIIETRRDKLLEEFKRAKEIGSIERFIETYLIQIQKIITSEFHRSNRCQQIITDFYSMVENYSYNEQIEVGQLQLGSPKVTSLEEQTLQVLIDGIFLKATKIFNNDEVSDDKKGGKKDDKKNVKKGGKEEVVVEQQETPLLIEMKQAILKEKNIFLNRIENLRVKTLSQVKDLINLGNQGFQKIENFIQYSFKQELDAMETLGYLIRQKIEEEQKIQLELQLDYVNVIISHKTLNFQTPPPVLLSAREQRSDNFLTISQLIIIIEEIRQISGPNFQIETIRLQQLFLRKIQYPFEVPQIIANLTQPQILYLIKNLDPNDSGLINGKQLCTYLSLLNCVIPNEKNLDDYSNALNAQAKGGFINKESFTKVPSFYDDKNDSLQEQNTNKFQRLKYIKEIIFDINVEKGKDLNIQDFLKLFIFTNNSMNFYQELFSLQ